MATKNRELKMKFQNIVINLSRTISLSDGRSESINISYNVQLDEESEDPQEVYSSIYRLLNLQLNSWERELRQETQNNLFLSSEPPPVTTAASMMSNDENQMNKVSIPSATEILCPKCNKKMFQKDGKSYFTCPNKHWGYLEMIRKGEVRSG